MKAAHSWLCLAIGFAALPVPAWGGPIRFKNAPLDLQRKAPQQVAAELAAGALLRAAPASHFILQFERPVSDADRAKLQAAGVTLLDFLGDNGYFVSVIPDRYDAQAVGEVATLTRVSEIAVGHKLHPWLLAGEIHDWMIARSKAQAGAPSSVLAPEEDPILGAYVRFHGDVLATPDGAALVQQYGGLVRTELLGVNTLVIELPYSQIRRLALEDAVAWIEPPAPPLQEINSDAQVRTGANIVQAAPYNLNGSGITALVYDGGKVRATHVDFQGRAVLGAGDFTGTSSHSTHVACTIGGAGVAVAANEGMAPAVGLISYGVENSNLYNLPGDLQSDYSAAINTHGADISNNSIGMNVASNGLPCSLEGDYNVTDTLIDAIVRGSVSGGWPFRIIWAAGNERQSSACNDPNIPAGYHKTAPPANAKNHITVGALNSNNDSMTNFSSWGPTDDDRMKPDVTAPGCQSTGDLGITSCSSSSDTAYTVMCGTSMSSPVVTGLASLLLQDYCAQYPARCPGGNKPDMRNSTLKILLAHTAVDLGNAGPDYQYGYGSVRIQPAIDLMRSGRFLEDSVGQDGVFRIFVPVAPTDTLLKVTLAWDDPPGTPNVLPTLVNDLDLVVIDPSNNQRFPWTLGGLANPTGLAIKTQKNSVDNIEQVHVASPPPGLYRVEVRGYSVPQGPQAFSLCASPSLAACSSIGYAELDNSQYNCASVATLTVIDCDLNTNNSVAEMVNVSITSTSEPGGETVTLTETGPQTAKFIGTISMSATNSPGVLQVAGGDSVILTYIDANDGQGGLNVPRTSNATVDCISPAISDVRISNVGSRSATITFVTNENTRGTARYGASCGSLTGSASEVVFRTSHTIVLSGLTPLTPYRLAVDAADPGGNIVTEDNGGTCHSFTTLAIPTFYTEEFPEGSPTDQFDLDFKSILFTPQAGSSGYVACVNNIASLPTDPTGGTTVTGWAIFPGSTGPLDDGTAYLTVSGGNTVKLHGRSYDYMHVSTNGNIHFTTPDGDYDKTLAKHYNQPRICALFDDLNLTSQGTCTWKELSDRFVVTWENVPEWTQSGTGPGNTFQIEMFFDGRIRLSYLAIPNLDGIVGLSPGGGVSPDYTDTDLSAQADCGPEFPPYAYGNSVSTAINTLTNVPLVAYDYDGDSLTYAITSLPLHGKLRDPVAGGTIVSVPYTLAGGGSTVRYTPDAGFLGADYFQFKANDGGTPTTGGDSNIADINLSMVLPSAPVLSFPLDTNPGWTATSPYWSFGVPLGGCGDPTSGFTGANVYGNTLTAAGCYSNNVTQIRYLTTTALNCSSFSGTRLRFRRWLNIEPNDRANIQVSRNGTTWSSVWDYITATLTETSWSLQTYDISAVADGQSTVFIRWGVAPTNATTAMGGWNIDDVEILASVPSPCGSILRGDVDASGVIDGGDIDDFVRVLTDPGSASTAQICAADCYTDSTVNLLDLDELVILLLNPTVP